MPDRTLRPVRFQAHSLRLCGLTVLGFMLVAFTLTGCSDEPTPVGDIPTTTPTPTIMPSPTSTPISTPTTFPSPSLMPIVTLTAVPSPTSTPTVVPSPTQPPTAMLSPSPTPTVVPPPTSTPTAAPQPSSTPTIAPSPSPAPAADRLNTATVPAPSVVQIEFPDWVDESPKPESTEGGGWVSVLKRQEGAPLNLGIMVL